MQHAPWQRSAMRAVRLLADKVATAKPLLAGKLAPAEAGLRHQLVGTLRRLRRRARSPLSATAAPLHRAATPWSQHELSVRRALAATAPMAAAVAVAVAVAPVATWASTRRAVPTAQGARHGAKPARHVVPAGRWTRWRRRARWRRSAAAAARRVVLRLGPRLGPRGRIGLAGLPRGAARVTPVVATASRRSGEARRSFGAGSATRGDEVRHPASATQRRGCKAAGGRRGTWRGRRRSCRTTSSRAATAGWPSSRRH